MLDLLQLTFEQMASIHTRFCQEHVGEKFGHHGTLELNQPESRETQVYFTLHDLIPIGWKGSLGFAQAVRTNFNRNALS